MLMQGQLKVKSQWKFGIVTARFNSAMATTSCRFHFWNATITAGEQADSIFVQIILPEHSKCSGFSGRALSVGVDFQPGVNC